MASNASMECGICNEIYNEQEFCPRMLPCFDCICSSCIDQLIKTNNQSCPFCRKAFQATSANDFRPNNALLDLVKYIAEVESGKRSHYTKRTKSFAAWKKDFRRDINEGILAECVRSKAQIQGAIERNEKMEERFLQVNGEIKNEIQRDLLEIEEINGKRVKELQDNKAHLRGILDTLLKEEGKIKDAYDKLEGSVNFTSAGPVIDSIEGIEKSIKTFSGEVEEFISKEEVMYNDIKMELDYTKRKVSIIQEILSTEREEENEAAIITANDLRRMSGPLRKLVENGRFLAFQEYRGRRRYAVMKMASRQRLLLFHLKELEHLPDEVLLVKHEGATIFAGESSKRTFLELDVGGAYQLMLIIRFINNGSYAQNFFHLCLGDLGPSYAGCKFLEVIDKDNDGERIITGDYERNDGNGGKAVIQGVDWGGEGKKDIYLGQTLEEGLVGGGSNLEERVSKFIIVTSTDQAMDACYPFGMVEEGLGILRDAILHYPNTPPITIRNCGMVLPL
ncbi:E3 ubiquitin-protein ligase TRIM13-like [Palaemon carinicauda]|uniref:E3 ubiquitin-protein ligase TRIM13-like n=1 Tax=Palaemon carinicauda TaxID=392227 RepID=UPI0035B67DBD